LNDSNKINVIICLHKNEEMGGKIEDYLANTYDMEQLVGGRFWDRVSGSDIHPQKKTPRKIWEY
jgi:endonuclease G